MKLRTARRTPTAAPEGSVRCDLCQRHVPVSADGRCVLGHRLPAVASVAAPPVEEVDAEEAAPTAEAAEAAEDADTEPLDAPGVAAEDGPAVPVAASDPVDYLDQLGDLGAFATAPTAAPDSELHHPYDDVLAAEAQQAAETEPLSWLEQLASSAQPEPVTEPPLAHTPAPVDDEDRTTEALTAGDLGTEDLGTGAEAPGAVQAEAVAEDGDDPAPDPTEAVDAAWDAMLASEQAEAAEDARLVRRQRVAMFTGVGIFTSLTMGATALALLS